MKLLQGQLTDIEDFIHDKLRKYVALTDEKTDTKKRKKKGEKSRSASYTSQSINNYRNIYLKSTLYYDWS